MDLTKKLQARYLREKITKGYHSSSTFYALVYVLTDGELLESHAAHAALQNDHAEHLALLKIARDRQPKADTRLNRLYQSAAATQ